MFKKLMLAFVVGWLAAPPMLNADSTHRNSIMGTGARRDTIEFEFIEPSAGSAQNLEPGTDNTNALGTSSKRFSDVQTLDATIGDDLAVTDDMTVGDDAVFGSTVTETATFNGLIRPAIHITPDASVTPTAAGQLIWNTTPTLWELCVSTGATAGAWVRFSTPTAACSN